MPLQDGLQAECWWPYGATENWVWEGKEKEKEKGEGSSSIGR
eukprot:COSAG05_NODE_1373_length_5052_cov_4.590955_5_plen_41_part_01